MDKQYKHNNFESRIYDMWEENRAFTPPPTSELIDSEVKPYCIIMPPPNANDPLHVGHAMFVTIEDILIRFERMRGKAVLWLPGTDHAGIETQYVFEKKLKKKGKSRFDYDRETLFEEIWKYVKKNSDVSVEQMKQLGASADWSRLKFTLGDEVVDLVLSTFEKMHDEGLIEKKVDLVNFSPRAGTSFSELEVVYKDRTSPLYYIKYRLADNPIEWISVATTRPEPIFADTHLAVNPKDELKKHLIGSKVLNPLTDVEMVIIGDEFVDPEFGTGIVKLTPAHDYNDFEVAKRHNLPIHQAIDMEGKITTEGGKYAGLRVKKAREQVVDDLSDKGLLEKVDDNYQNRVATCYKTGCDIEPLPLSQFFVKVKPLTEKVLKALDDGETKVYGSGHDKILRHWLENLNDWNISRQIVWGIRMPVWYQIISDKSGGELTNQSIVVGFLNKEKNFIRGRIDKLLDEYNFSEIEEGLQTLSAPEESSYIVSRAKPGDGYLQETDTFDTWFSSSQWPVVTLKTSGEGDFEYYYPTATMETAYDILVFWVMRMMMMGIYLTGKSPFKNVYLHGLVRDEKGQKMSKSKGNVINPIDLVDKYGADAVRMALAMSTTAGNDSAVGENKVRGMRNLANKTWNAARYVKMSQESEISNAPIKEVTQKYANDEDFEEKMNEVISKATKELDDMKIGQAAETVHNEFWHWFCDECIESHKQGLLSPTLLEKGIRTFLKLLHPFVPFVTESIWQEMFESEGLLMLDDWPEK